MSNHMNFKCFSCTKIISKRPCCTVCLLELNADDVDINNTLGSAEYSSEGIAQTENQVIISTA